VPDGRTLTFQSLQPLVPALATFVLSFIMVGVYWIAHHHMLHFIKQVNRRLLWLNLLVLLCVVFIPFPASLLGTGFNNPLAVRLYGLSLIATNASGLFFWLYAISQSELNGFVGNERVCAGCDQDSFIPDACLWPGCRARGLEHKGEFSSVCRGAALLHPSKPAA